MIRAQPFSLIVLSLAFSWQAEAQDLAIHDLPLLIDKKNHAVQRSTAELEAARAEEDVAGADFLPTLTFKATQTRTDDAITIDVPNQSIRRTLPNGAPFALDIDPPALTIQDRDVSKAQLVLTQALYTGGRLSSQAEARRAETSIKTAELRMERNRQLTLVLTRYFQTLAGQELTRILSQFEGHLTKIDQLTESLIQTGSLPAFMRQKTKSALADLKAKRVQAEAQTEVLCRATHALVAYVGPCLFRSTLELLSLPESLQDLQQLATQGRPEFHILREQKNRADAAYEAATGSLLPSVYAFGRRELIEKQLTALDPVWVIGVGLEWNLTAGLKSFPERKRAFALKQKVEAAEQQAQRDVPLQMEQLWAQARGERAAWEATHQAVEAASETLRIQNLRFASGDASQFEVLQAYSEFEKLSMRELELKESYNRALIELFSAAGDVQLYIQHYRQHP